MTSQGRSQAAREATESVQERGSPHRREGASARLGLDRMPRKPAVPPPQRGGSAVRSRVRPYARTGGRTEPARELAIEALVSTIVDEPAFMDAGSAEHRLVCELCVHTHSVAEIAAYLGLPLAVVKVFVGDLAEAGLVRVHQPCLLVADRSSREFMERVLAGLRAL